MRPLQFGRGRSTQPGEHRAVLLNETIEALDPMPGEIVVDCTLGFGGHSTELLKKVGPTGKLIGMDLDPLAIENATKTISAVGSNFSLHHSNFAGIQKVLGAENLTGVHCVLADLGMSSMQLDLPERGFSYMRDGPLDMRLDPTRGTTAAQLLAKLDEEKLAEYLLTIGDEPEAEYVANAIITAQKARPIERTSELTQILLKCFDTPQRRNREDLAPSRWNNKPLSRVFQTLRILVNREMANLENLLRVARDVLLPGGRIAIISFHSGEDRMVKKAFREGVKSGVFSAESRDPIRPTQDEVFDNPRSRSAKLRWAVRSKAGEGAD